MDISRPSSISRLQIGVNLGIEPVHYSRNTIGYVEQGTKRIHQGDKYVTVHCGELFHLEKGTHYIENSPLDADTPFRQVLFFYSPTDLQSTFTPSEKVSRSSQVCSQCRNTTGIYTFPATRVIRDFFESNLAFIDSQAHIQNPEWGHMKLCELVQLMLAQPGCCICRPIGQAVTTGKDSMTEVLRNNFLSGISITDMARLCEMSLSMFKNEFKRNFRTTPHKWITEQRLSHARVQLLTSNRSIADIAEECHFNNSSHFIKLFKERYKTTPSVYRRANRSS